MGSSRVLIAIGVMLAGGCGMEAEAELELAAAAEASLDGDSRLDCLDCTRGDERETEPEITVMSDANYVPAPSDHPSPVTLSGKLFVTSKPQLVLDADQDFQLDYLEHEIATKVAPFMQWSQYENARHPHEPLVLYQVHPITCTGVACSLQPAAGVAPAHRYGLLVRYGMIWAWDGGYGGNAPGSWCGDSHAGDTQTVTVELVSEDGVVWHIVKVQNSHYEWPGDAATFRSSGLQANTHVVIYYSAGKHHQFFDTAMHDEDSPYSDWNCNDVIDGAGELTLAQVETAAVIEHNVGEKAHHDAAAFISALTIFGYPNYSAWSYNDFLAEGTTGPGHLWVQSEPVGYAGYLPDHGTGYVTGHIDGGSSDLVLYYRRANATGEPWSTVPLDGHNFAMTLSSGQSFELYMYRPVASDYDFFSPYGYSSGAVPRTAIVANGNTFNMSFEGEANLQQNSGSGLELVATDDNPVLQGLGQVSVVGQKVGRGALRPEVPEVMVAQNSATYSMSKDPATGLYRGKVVSVRLLSALDANDQPALSAEDVDHDIINNKLIFNYGAGVPGATVEIEILGGSGVVDPGAAAKITRTTDAAGEVFANLQTGNHPGRIRVRVRVTSNPVNPWLLPSRDYTITVQPDVSHDDRDFVLPLRPRVVPALRFASSSVIRVP